MTTCAFNGTSEYVMHGWNVAVCCMYMLKNYLLIHFSKKHSSICAMHTQSVPQTTSYMLPQHITIQWNPTYQSLTECSIHQGGLYIYKINKNKYSVVWNMKLRWLLTNNVGNKNPNFRVFLPPSSYNDDICEDIFLLEQNPT